jgi:hypothetical protein
MKTLLLACLLVTFACAPFFAPASADHGCNGVVTAIGPLYLDDRSGGDPMAIDHWLYLESNGVEGLQSGSDGSQYPGNDFVSFDDPCDHENPDTHIF